MDVASYRVQMLPTMDVQMYAAILVSGFLIWFVLAWWRRESVASGVFAFCVMLAIGWAHAWFFVLIGLAIGKPLSGITMPLAESIVAATLLIVVVTVSGLALVRGRAAPLPVALVSAAIVGHAFHVGAVYGALLSQLP